MIKQDRCQAGSNPAPFSEVYMYNKKDKVIFKSYKTKEPNVEWIRKSGTILEIIVVNGNPAYNILVDNENTIEPVLFGAVESKVTE